MGKLAYERQINERLRGKHHLRPLFTSTYFIPERLSEYDPNLFVVFNTKKQRYEVHSLANKGDTFGFVVPLNELDYRTLYLARKNNLRTRGKQIFREIDEANEKLERSNARQRDNEIRAIAEELKPVFAKVAWEGV